MGSLDLTNHSGLDLPWLARLEDRTPPGIAGAVSRAIHSGALAPGDRMPTVREVAATLGVSPATVSSAWQALRRTGVLAARGRAGTFVQVPNRAWLTPRQRGLLGSEPSTLRIDLSRGTPDPDLLPALGPALGRVSARAVTLTYQEEPVIEALHTLLTQTWPCPAQTFTIVDGATDGVARALEQAIRYGDRVVLESPTFPMFFDLVESLGGEVVPVELDGEGIVADSLRRALSTRPAAVLLQPRAHNPTGVSMTPARARVLAQVLRQAPGGVPWVIEDDHSGPISTSRQVSLGEHLPDQVVHVRSFSKSHGPDLRIAALAGPTALVEPLIARRMLGPGWTSRMLQSVLVDLLTQARSMDEVAEARRQYFRRQRDLCAALRSRGLELLMIADAPDGINLWLPVRDESAALLRLAAADIRAAAGAPFFCDAGAPHIRVTAAMVHPEDVDYVADALVDAVRAI